MTRDAIREQIAAEAARLLLRGKEQDFSAARKRAARWLKRRRLHRDEVPSNQEIQVQLYALSGLMASERDPMLRAQVRHWTCQILTALEPSPAVWLDGADDVQLAAGAAVVIAVQGALNEIRERLAAGGFDPHRVHQIDPATGGEWRLQLHGQFPCEIHGFAAGQPLPTGAGVWTAGQLRTQLEIEPAAPYEPADDEHPDAFAVFQMLLEPLARVVWPSDIHPEGDALYHSMQVFELGRLDRPYDEEFLLACLLHDVGWGINPRHPVLSAIDALGTLITDRTRYLIEQRPVASQYLVTGDCPRALKRSEDFEDVVLLARCDRDGRVPGARVCTLEEAFAYVEGLEGEWD
ncbi:MAG: hypothetical protein SFV23_20325 [Planctomycetaceae bacterium]|nr:hypothetical protein [Planctomycetaceae bacterium]